MKKLAVIGGSYLQLPVVKKAKEMGIEVHCFSWTDGAVCKEVADFFYPISIIEKETILYECRNIGIDGILSIASDIAVTTVNYIAEKLGLVGNKDKYSTIMTNKFAMKDTLVANGVLSSKCMKVREAGASLGDLALPLIVKPTDRSGSLGVEKINNIDNIDVAIQSAIDYSFSKEAIVEEFIIGSEVSVEAISWKGEHHILAITDKVTTGSPHFVELEHHQPSQLSINIQSRIKEIVTKSLDVLHVDYGASHSELIITVNGDIYVIEIGARMGGDFIGSDLVQLSTGYDFLRGVIEVSLGNFTVPVIKDSLFSGIYFLSKETECLKSVLENSDKYSEIVRSEITSNDLKHVHASSERSGYFIYQAERKFKSR